MLKSRLPKVKSAKASKLAPDPIKASAAKRKPVARTKAVTAAASPVALALDTPPARKPRRPSSKALIQRVIDAIERELSQIETIVNGAAKTAASRTDSERRARTLASLARTLTEVRRLRAEEIQVRSANDTTAPRDLDELRRTLWKRLERTLRTKAPATAEGDERS